MPNNSKKNVFKIVLSQKEAGAAVPLIILMVIVSFVNKNFFGLNNLMDVLRTASFWIMIAVPAAATCLWALQPASAALSAARRLKPDAAFRWRFCWRLRSAC